MVEAIETLFVPVAIRNNVEGYEREVLERFEEPTWNNPVVRFLDGAGQDVIPREDRVWGTGEVLARMLAALEAAQREVPVWLDVYAQETLPGEPARAVFAMHCFWVGQAKLGGLDGVVSARPGWVGGLEVVDVRYRPERLKFERLLSSARELECCSELFTTTQEQAASARAAGGTCKALVGEVRPAKSSDHLHDLARSPLRCLPLTPLQALRVNSALAAGEAPTTWLSPSQRALVERIVAHPERVAHLRRPGEVAGLAQYTLQLEAALERE